MDNIEESVAPTRSFVQHVFNFDVETKGDLMNLLQYSVLAIIPIVLLNKLIQNYVPEVDEEKGSLELTVEVLAQLSLLLVGMFFINRVVTYLPMYSGKDIGVINIAHMLLGFLVIVLSLQTKLGEKVDILAQRVVELWGGPEEKHVEQPKNIVKVSQPISQQMPIHQPSQADALARSMDMSPTQMPMPQQQPQQQQQPQSQPQQGYGMNFDSMYQEPMAANDGFGAFGSIF